MNMCCWEGGMNIKLRPLSLVVGGAQMLCASAVREPGGTAGSLASPHGVDPFPPGGLSVVLVTSGT